MDRRRRDEEIQEKLLGKVVTAAEAMNNRGPKLGTKDGEKEASLTRQVTPVTSLSNSSNEGSGGEDPSVSDNAKKRKSGRLTPNSVASKDIPRTTTRSTRRRGSWNDDSVNNSSSAGVAKIQKKVKISQASHDKSIGKKQNAAKTKAVPARVGTRATRGTSGEALAGLLPDVMPRKKAVPKKTIKKDEHVVVVKMLTGTLYLHRGDRRRAEFIRFK